MATIEYLESERKKLWEELVELRDLIKKKTSDYEKDAREYSKKCAEFKNKCENRKNETEEIFAEIQTTKTKITQSNVVSLINDVKTFHATLNEKKQNLDSNVDQLETLFEEYDTYAEELEKLAALSTKAEEDSAKIEATLSQLTARKIEIDKIYYEIYGFSKTDDKGVVTKVSGRKEELEQAYLSLKNGFEIYSKDKKEEFDQTLIDWKTSYSSALTEIQSLLPNALTTGLSYAYSKKKEDELIEIQNLKKFFRNWIIVLMVISLIPFCVSIFLMIYENMTLRQVVLQLTNLVSPIIMLYIPPLWIAISTNKKINLSKRLIEEYTHKEVVTKTFEGLSKQIDGVKDQKVLSALKAKLLENILDISIENPGKLISDYNNSDHPILDRFSFFSKKEPNASPV